jgi:hypothetical protein
VTHDRPEPATGGRQTRVDWLRDQATAAERDMQQLVTVLAKRRRGQT